MRILSCPVYALMLPEKGRLNPVSERGLPILECARQCRVIRRCVALVSGRSSVCVDASRRCRSYGVARCGHDPIRNGGAEIHLCSRFRRFYPRRKRRLSVLVYILGAHPLYGGGLKVQVTKYPPIVPQKGDHQRRYLHRRNRQLALPHLQDAVCCRMRWFRFLLRRSHPLVLPFSVGCPAT